MCLSELERVKTADGSELFVHVLAPRSKQSANKSLSRRRYAVTTAGVRSLKENRCSVSGRKKFCTVLKPSERKSFACEGQYSPSSAGRRIEATMRAMIEVGEVPDEVRESRR